MRPQVVLAAIAVLPCLSFAQEVNEWGKEGDWSILVNPGNGYGCYAEKQFPDGTVVQIGSEPLRKGGFFAAYNAEWTHIEDGATGKVIFDFGSEKFGGEAVGRVQGGLPGGYAFFDNPNFVSEFAGRNSVKVSGNSEREAEISLAGTKRAIDAVKACQAEQPAPE